MGTAIKHQRVNMVGFAASGDCKSRLAVAITSQLVARLIYAVHQFYYFSATKVETDKPLKFGSPSQTKVWFFSVSCHFLIIIPKY